MKYVTQIVVSQRFYLNAYVNLVNGRVELWKLGALRDSKTVQALKFFGGQSFFGWAKVFGGSVLVKS